VHFFEKNDLHPLGVKVGTNFGLVKTSHISIFKTKVAITVVPNPFIG
jgi:hypothetical protein